MSTITFLFGAGADQPYGVCTGAKFSEELLLSGFKTERKALLGSDTSNFQLISANSIKVFIQSICANNEEATSVFGIDIVKTCESYLNEQPKESNNAEIIRKRCNDWYHIIMGDPPKHNNYTNSEIEGIKKFFLKNAVFFDSLDEKFNDLRNDPIRANGKRIVNAYYTVFILMLRQVYNIPESFNWSFDEVFKLLNQDYNRLELEDYKKKGKESYYDIVSSSGLSSVHIATSNYTNLARVGTGHEVTYLHGKLTWFEDYRNLRFYDVSDGKAWPKEYEHLIPFIMIPSGVKPIICQMQIDEYSKFIRDLNDSETLCVVGYRFNSEDNHINAIIGEWLRRDTNHKLVYFNYSSNEEEPRFLNWSSQRWARRSEIVSAGKDDKAEFEALLNSNGSIIDVCVTPSNSMGRFKAFLKEMEKRQ